MKTAPQQKNVSTSLSKYLAQAGIASRRKVIDLIVQGRIKVNGVTVKEPGFKVNQGDTVTYQNTSVRSEQKVYILLNKPKDYITTASDEKGRKTVLDLIKSEVAARVYPVGRLDRDTTGLLLLTNDGDLAQRLAHPRHEVQKTYIATLDRILSREDFNEIKNGITLKDGFIKVDAIHYAPEQKRTHVKVILHSGKNRIVRRIFEFFGYRVMKLDRVEYAGLRKKGLSVGNWRHLTAAEIERLRQ